MKRLIIEALVFLVVSAVWFCFLVFVTWVLWAAPGVVAIVCGVVLLFIVARVVWRECRKRGSK
jgi:membrane protein YdbS with pleckstrin-like domain